MLLTVSKRLEFSASRRLFSKHLSSEENRQLFGAETDARYGTGRNYTAWFTFSGEIDRATGMLVNISEIKARAGSVIDSRYDHKFLNQDNSSFVDMVPTVENVAWQLASDVAPLFRDSGARLWAVHLIESPERSATAYIDDWIDSNYTFDFSAARQTMSPHLSAEENEHLFGIASSPHGHGHNFRVRLTMRAKHGNGSVEIEASNARRAIAALQSELDHRNLNKEVASLRNEPVTTEALAHYIFTRAADTLPIDRVRLNERDDFFAEYLQSGEYRLGMQLSFGAVHRLQSYEFSEQQNAEMYGKCNNPGGHGHLYLSEATIGGAFDRRSGTLFRFTDLQKAMQEAIQPWNNRHLDLETKEFRSIPSTGENIVTALWSKLNDRLDHRLRRLRLWETPNNRFTLRHCLE
jgi:6-pyruvoyltetrahydropterin/6-carboxytetrahydropterin synthase